MHNGPSIVLALIPRKMTLILSHPSIFFFTDLDGSLRVGHEVGPPKVCVQGAKDVIKDLAHVRVVRGDANVLGRLVRQHLAEEGLLDAERGAGGHDSHGAGHGRVALLLLERVGHDEEGAEADGHALWGVDDLRSKENLVKWLKNAIIMARRYVVPFGKEREKK